MIRRENDSTFLTNTAGKEDVRLDLVPADVPADADMVIVASQVTNLEDDSTDLCQAHYRLNVRQADDTWKEIRGDDFTIGLQRKLQEQLETGFRSTDGARLCEMHEEFRYAHIPQHQARRLHGDHLADIRKHNERRNS